MNELQNNEKFYKFGRAVSCGIFNLTLNPTIIGSTLIPENGPIILCGNHLHVWDQFPVMCATKRPIHWMAKKEYFDGKMGPAFKMMGCIPVDRKDNPHEAKEIAIKYLENGSAVGLFPEGTRNQYQVAINEMEKIKKLYKRYEEQLDNNLGLEKTKQIEKTLNELAIKYEESIRNIEIAKQTVESKGNKVIETEELLPFKFGAVSMAQKTNALIVPFGVTGDYKLGNDNLTVRFGNPLAVENKTLEEANNELRTKILSLVKENKKENIK